MPSHKPKTKREKRIRRIAKVRAKVSGTAKKPRLNVFRSLNHIRAQIIDDTTGKTLVFASDDKIKKGTKVDKAKEVGKTIAKLAQEQKIKKVVFDRAGYKYHGRVKALAEAAREAGLEF